MEETMEETKTTGRNETTEAQETSGTKKPGNRKMVFAVIALIIAIAAAACLYFAFREKPSEGKKQITISVVGISGEATDYALQTDAEYLRQAMEEAEGLTFSGQESEYGMMVETVNGEGAVFAENGAYWSFYVNGDYCNYGIDTQPVEDGDLFRIEYTVDTAE